MYVCVSLSWRRIINRCELIETHVSVTNCMIFVLVCTLRSLARNLSILFVNFCCSCYHMVILVLLFVVLSLFYSVFVRHGVSYKACSRGSLPSDRLDQSQLQGRRKVAILIPLCGLQHSYIRCRLSKNATAFEILWKHLRSL
jgi:hypothetical protein